MASKITFRTWDGGSGESDKIVTIGYCREPPNDVLRRIHETHVILNYRGIRHPVDHRNPGMGYGLEIWDPEDIQEDIPKQVGSIDDLDLSRAKVQYSFRMISNYQSQQDQDQEWFRRASRITREDALSKAVGFYLRDFSFDPSSCYLLTRGFKPNANLEGYLSLILEIAKATLSPGADVKFLERISLPKTPPYDPPGGSMDSAYCAIFYAKWRRKL